MDWKEVQPLATKQLTAILNKNRVGHAYMFEGPVGVGKEQAMYDFVQAIFCESASELVSCGECRSCARFLSKNHPNFFEVFPDGQFIKTVQISELISEMTKTSNDGGKKIYAIHGAERLNASSSNKLLKFLEEPDSDVTAILLTEKLDGVLPTIRSRTQTISFVLGSKKYMYETLVQEGVSTFFAATLSELVNDLEVAKQLANDEQFAQQRKTVLKLMQVTEQHVQEGLLFVQEEFFASMKEKEALELGLTLLLLAYRDVVSVKVDKKEQLAFPDNISFFETVALQTSLSQISNKLEAILRAKTNLNRNMNRNLLMEQLVIDIQGGVTFV